MHTIYWYQHKHNDTISYSIKFSVAVYVPTTEPPDSFPEYSPPELYDNAIWCGDISSSPSSAMCTSCDFVWNLGQMGCQVGTSGENPGSSEVEIRLFLRDLVRGASSYAIRATVGNTFYYFVLPDLELSDVELDLTIPSIRGTPSEIWLLAEMDDHWSGVPLRNIVE